MSSTLTRKEIQQQRKPTYKKIVRIIWGLFLLGLIGFAILIFVASSGKIPSFESLENPKNSFTSELYTVDGKTLGSGYFTENRVPVEFSELSQNVVHALLATEDERYYEHSGIDLRGLARVGVKTVVLQQSAGGGSTITQQLAKLLYTNKNEGYARNIVERGFQKLREWVTALKLERTYTKDEIIKMYLNEFSFINGAYGIKAAAETYFGANQDSLNIQQAAVLVGMLQNPSLFNPVRFPERTLKRREIVLKQMQRNNYLTQAEYDSIRVLPLGLNFTRSSHNDGMAQHFRMVLRDELKRILKNDAQKKKDGETYNIYQDGLKIYTTLDTRYQLHAESAMQEHMEQIQKTFWNEWKRGDPWTYRDEEDTREEHDRKIRIRQNTLKRLIRETDLYQALRKKHLEKSFAKAQKAFPKIKLRDSDLELMADGNKGIVTLVNEDAISSKQASNYRTIIRSPQWESLSEDWKTFQGELKKEFETPVKMTVFAYNDKNEVDTMMTPLEAIKYHRMFLQTGIMAVNPINGHVKAWVGGINFKHFQYDHVTSNRQVGSTFKPFVYATAIGNKGFSPCQQVLDVQHTIGVGDGQFFLDKDWSPKNFSDFTNRNVTLREGLKKSLNSVSVWLMKSMNSARPVVDLVSRMGIDTNSKYRNGQKRVQAVPSLALGATDLSVYEMTGAYTTFANNGIYNKPVFITRIEDRKGRVIYEEEPIERQALDASTNYVMVEMLKYAGRGKRGFGEIKTEEYGGKTGTTNDAVDGWFMGITPNLVVGTWVGGEDKWIRFKQKSQGQGGRMAAPFFGKFLTRLEKDKSLDWDKEAEFFRPPGELGIVIDCSLYEQAPVEGEEELVPEDDSFFDDPFGDEEEDDFWGDPAEEIIPDTSRIN